MGVAALHPLDVEVDHVNAIDKCCINGDGSVTLKIRKLSAPEISVNALHAGNIRIARVDAEKLSLNAGEKGKIEVSAGACKSLKSAGIGTISCPDGLASK